MKKSVINWKTILGALGIFGLMAGWAVTTATTNDNKTEIKETKKDVEGLKELVYAQKVMKERTVSNQ